MGSSDAELVAAMRRVPRWWMVPLVSLVVLGALSAAFWAGTIAAPAAAPSAAPASVQVSALVERRSVVKQVTVAGKVVQAAQHEVVAVRPPGVDRLVVMSQPKQAGAEVHPGQLLAVVSGRPLLILPNKVPLFRDLSSGDKGADVLALQGALTDLGYSTAQSGVFDEATRAALSAWYGDVGSEAPTGGAESSSQLSKAPGSGTEASGQSQKLNVGSGGVIFKWSEFIQIPRDSGKIATMAAQGAVLGEDGIVARLVVADDTVVARLDLLQAESFKIGNTVKVRAGSAVADLTVTSVSSFKDGDSAKNIVPGKDLTIRLPPGTKGFAADQSVTISVGNESAKSIALPLIAIRQEQGNAFVELETANGGLKRVDVQVIAQADGWVGLAENSDLPTGAKVRLP